MIAIRSELPEVTGEAYDWWFSWHLVETSRSKLWNPVAHQYVYRKSYGLGSEFNDFRISFNLHYTIVPMTVAGETQDAVTLKKTIAAAEDFEARNLKTEASQAFLARTSGEKRANTGFRRKLRSHCGNIHGKNCWKMDDRNAPQWWKQRMDLQDRLAPPKRRRGDDDAGITIMGPRGSKSPETGYNAVLLTVLSETPLAPQEVCLFKKKNHTTSDKVMTIHRGVNLWDTWILDTGASGHLVGRKDVFVDGTFKTHRSRVEWHRWGSSDASGQRHDEDPLQIE